MKKTKYHSYKIGKLPKGCKQCVKGRKEVIFITGLCPRDCYFCPISDDKHQKDVVYADEWKTTKINEIIKEAELIGAEGAGITGGDPLCKLKRTCSSIKELKKHFKEKFHIHLYTSLNLVNKKTLKKLHKTGLDEIRFHLDLDDDKLWDRIKLAFDYDWDVGIEIPVIPKIFTNYIKILNFIKKINEKSKKIKFLNLNELEMSDNSFSNMSEFRTKDDLSYAVKGSEELALKLLKYIEKNKINIDTHYCTAKLKDRVQLANRIKNRAKNSAEPFDKVNSNGTITRGVIYLDKLIPGFGYNKKINSIKNKKKYLNNLKKLKDETVKDNSEIINEYNKKIKNTKTYYKKVLDNNKIIKIDKNKLRLITSAKLIKQLKTKNKKAIVTQYPTHDQLELELDFV